MLTTILNSVNTLETTFTTLKLNLIIGAIINLIIIAFLFKLTNVFTKKLYDRAQKNDSSMLSKQLIIFLDKTIKFLILFFVIASFLQTNGYSITSLVAGFGITGVAVAFAAQKTVADFFGTLTIIADKMYKIGDYIKIADIEGNVEDVNLFSTKIRTLEDFLVTIPNNNISSSNVINITKAKKRRINEVFGVTYDTSNEKLCEAIEIIKKVCEDNSSILQSPNVFIETLSASSIDIRLQAYVKTGVYVNLTQVRSQVILEVVKHFRNANINFAFPSQSIYIEKQ